MRRLFALGLWHELWLPATYDLFLEKLGPQTRRNMRYYRRRAEKEGWTFVSDIGREEAFAAMTSLYPLRQAGRKNWAELTGAERNLSEVPGAFFSGLRTATGEWISVLGGWVRGANMFILMQLNNATYPKASLSTVLRSYVIEKAIDSGIRHIKFIGGCEGSLKTYCRPERTCHLLVQKRDPFSQMVIEAVRRLFPTSLIGDLCSRPPHKESESPNLPQESS